MKVPSIRHGTGYSVGRAGNVTTLSIPLLSLGTALDKMIRHILRHFRHFRHCPTSTVLCLGCRLLGIAPGIPFRISVHSNQPRPTTPSSMMLRPHGILTLNHLDSPSLPARLSLPARPSLPASPCLEAKPNHQAKMSRQAQRSPLKSPVLIGSPSLRIPTCRKRSPASQHLSKAF